MIVCKFTTSSFKIDVFKGGYVFVSRSEELKIWQNVDARTQSPGHELSGGGVSAR